MFISTVVQSIFVVFRFIIQFLPDAGINDVAMADGMVDAMNNFFSFISWANFWFPVDTLWQVFVAIIQLEILGFSLFVSFQLIKLIRG
jgi:hypothetical protein